METIQNLRQRRAAGERVSQLASEVGVPWQKLDKILRHFTGDAAPTPVSRLLEAARGAAGTLTDRYRPRSLDAILGQPSVVKFLKRFAANPGPMAFLCEGETGTGKTTVALALAAELGCSVEHAEFGGVWTIASGEQSADSVRETYRRLSLTPMFGNGWKVAIVNEADRMNKSAETIWLDALENLPARSVVVFTTNFCSTLSSRFRDRCVRLTFASDPKRLDAEARLLVDGIWRQEIGKPPPSEIVAKVLAAGVEDGKLSFRRVVQSLQVQLMEGGAL
jgi:hypothetical protein